MSLFGTEIAFRLGPGTLEEARAIAAELADAAAGCRRHVLFVDAAAGEYGCLAEWERRADAEGYAARPAAALRGTSDACHLALVRSATLAFELPDQSDCRARRPHVDRRTRRSLIRTSRAALRPGALTAPTWRTGTAR